MGKLTLLFVLAAVVGGSMLSLSTRSLAGQASGRRAETQASQLARQIAESGRNLAVSAMLTPDGLVDPNIGTREYDGGAFRVEFAGASDNQTASLTVVGTYAGATHTIRSQYQFDPLDFPSPIWIDAPYATSAVSGEPQIHRGDRAHPVAMDPRQHTALGLVDLPLRRVDEDFDADLRPIGAWMDQPAASAWAGPLLEDLNVADAEGLYQTALTAMTAADRTVAAPAGGLTVSSVEAWTGPTTITRVPGNLTVVSGGRVSGEGVLLVDGGLDVQPGGRLAWTGLVIARSGAESHYARLNGSVSVTGALVLRQEPVAPVGHLDVTVWRSATGLSSPQGAHQAAPWNAGEGPFPWTQHSHRFDLTHPEGRHVFFLEGGGAGRHEAETQFAAAVDAAGSEPVYLQFVNEAYHGFGRYRLGIDGEGVFDGAVRQGFPSAIRGSSTMRTRAVPARSLETLTVDLRALPALRRRFDTREGCDSWPFCIGADWNRGGTLRLRMLRASNAAVLYEAAFYWHMRQDEVAAHEAEVAALLADIVANESFGTHLRLGDGVRIAYSRAPIVALSERLGFDGDAMRLVSTTSSHQTAAEARAAASSATPPSAYPFQMCHVANNTTRTITNAAQYADHAGHGDAMGACASSGSSGSS